MAPTKTALPSLTTFADRDPFDFYEQVRSQGQAVWDEGMECWLVTGLEDCNHVLRHEDLFAAPWLNMDFSKIHGRRSLFMVSGEQHRGLYNTVTPFFSKGVVDNFRHDFVRPLIEARIAKLTSNGTASADMFTDFAQEIPVRVIGAMLGISWQDEQLGKDVWKMTEGFLAHSRTWLLPDAGAETQTAAEDSVQELNELLMPYVISRGQGNPDSYIARLWDAGGELFDDWTADDVLDMCRFLFTAGVHTTTEAIANVIYIMVTEGFEPQLRDNRAELAPFIEEVLRLFPPVHIRMRVAAEDTTIGEARINQGEKVCALLGAANRDPQRFSNPTTIDLARRPISGHITFSRGPRACSGAPLARSEIWETMDALLDGVNDLKFDRSKEPPIYSGFLQRVFRPLHMTFEAQ